MQDARRHGHGSRRRGALGTRGAGHSGSPGSGGRHRRDRSADARNGRHGAHPPHRRAQASGIGDYRQLPRRRSAGLRRHHGAGVRGKGHRHDREAGDASEVLLRAGPFPHARARGGGDRRCRVRAERPRGAHRNFSRADRAVLPGRRRGRQRQCGRRRGAGALAPSDPRRPRSRNIPAAPRSRRLPRRTVVDHVVDGGDGGGALAPRRSAHDASRSTFRRPRWPIPATPMR